MLRLQNLSGHEHDCGDGMQEPSQLGRARALVKMETYSYTIGITANTSDFQSDNESSILAWWILNVGAI